MSSRIVLIGPSNTLPGLQERLDSGAEVQSFADSEALEALDHIIRTKPALVALHDGFADSSRGQALINRIKDDVALGTCEVRVMTKTAAPHGDAAKRGSPGSRTAKLVLDSIGTRRAPRSRIKDGIDVAVDARPAALIDLSTVGAQVVSPTVLKPNQRVRVVIGDGRTAVTCLGAIVWATFEMPPGMPTRYRAGIDFGGKPDAAGIDGFAKKHKKD